jgi:hypothetical protein
VNDLLPVHCDHIAWISSHSEELTHLIDASRMYMPSLRVIFLVTNAFIDVYISAAIILRRFSEWNADCNEFPDWIQNIHWNSWSVRSDPIPRQADWSNFGDRRSHSNLDMPLNNCEMRLRISCHPPRTSTNASFCSLARRICNQSPWLKVRVFMAEKIEAAERKLISICFWKY